jgi:hypothetical protein
MNTLFDNPQCRPPASDRRQHSTRPTDPPMRLRPPASVNQGVYILTSSTAMNLYIVLTTVHQSMFTSTVELCADVARISTKRAHAQRIPSKCDAAGMRVTTYILTRVCGVFRQALLLRTVVKSRNMHTLSQLLLAACCEMSATSTASPRTCS